MSAQSPPIVIVQNSGPGLLVRVIYFLFVGWWLGLIASTVAWILNVTIIGLPLGLAIINHLAGIITLRPPSQKVTVEGNVATVHGEADRVSVAGHLLHLHRHLVLRRLDGPRLSGSRHGASDSACLLDVRPRGGRYNPSAQLTKSPVEPPGAVIGRWATRDAPKRHTAMDPEGDGPRLSGWSQARRRTVLRLHGTGDPEERMV